jgi:hypothetical protein
MLIESRDKIRIKITITIKIVNERGSDYTCEELPWELVSSGFCFS